MKKAVIFAAAAALALSLTACGGQGSQDRNDANGAVTNGSTSSDNGVNANNSARAGTQARSSIGSDVRRGLDDVGDAVEDMWEDGKDAVRDMTRTTSFQQMLDNARVRDADGILTDGENSRW